MAQTSKPWQSTTPGDAGPYSASSWWEIYKYLAGPHDENTGPLVGSGTAPDIGLSVNAQGTPSANVDITAGAASVQGTFYENDATVTLGIAANGSGNPRIDTVILRKDVAAQTVRLAILQGTPAASPIPLALTQTIATYEIPLADITVVSGFTVINQPDITPRRYWANAAEGVYLLDVKNNSGASLQAGDVVVWDSTADRAVTTTTTVNHNLTAGVWMSYTASAGYGRVLVRGIGYVRCSAAVATRGLQLTTGTTVKQANVSAAGITYAYEIGISLQTTSGAGLCLTYINVRRPRLYASSQVIKDNNANYTTASTTLADVHATDFTVTVNAGSGNFIVEIMCSLLHSVANARVAFDVSVDGTDYYTTTLGFASGAFQPIFNGVGAAGAVSVRLPVTGLSVGSHTFKLRWRTITAGTLTLYAGAAAADTNFPAIFRVQEVD